LVTAITMPATTSIGEANSTRIHAMVASPISMPPPINRTPPSEAIVNATSTATSANTTRPRAWWRWS
jgi:hypothetical protein